MTMQIQNRPIVSPQGVPQEAAQGLDGSSMLPKLSSKAPKGLAGEFDLALEKAAPKESKEEIVSLLDSIKQSKKPKSDQVTTDQIVAQNTIVQQPKEVVVKPLVQESVVDAPAKNEGKNLTKEAVGLENVQKFKTQEPQTLEKQVQAQQALEQIQKPTPKTTGQKDIAKQTGPRTQALEGKLMAMQDQLAPKQVSLESSKLNEGSVSQLTGRAPASVEVDPAQMQQLPPELAGMIGAMEFSGDNEEVSGPRGGQKEVGSKKGANQKSSILKSSLSGAEFLSALHSAKQDKVTPLNERSVLPNNGSMESLDQNQDLTNKISSGKPRNFGKNVSKISEDQWNDALKGPSAQAHGAQNLSVPIQTAGKTLERPTFELSGHVVPGSMAQDRLARDSVVGIGSQIKNISVSGGAGEIRVKLKPENLGELHLRVISDGKNVELKIHTKDEKTKQIIEESMASLRESLASHSLELAKVDVSHQSGSSSGNDSRPEDQRQFNNNSFDGGNFAQNSGNSAWGGGDSQSESRYSQSEFSLDPQMATVKPGLASRTYSSKANAEAGRLDVRV